MRWACGVVAAVVVVGLAGCIPQPRDEQGRLIVPVSVDFAEVSDGYLRAGGQVLGVIEDGGTCSFTFYGAGGGASRLTSSGHGGVSSTECDDVDEPIATLFPGEYELVLRYSSEDSVGESEPFPLTIPEH
ncbi:hypothetical protein [Antiquaquibacter soli]|uniref:Uncharacterized protein n=1 Tax=Antiquaquibacter soli TaxID=3064523 RepID=A0ABT9BIG8_9MICO|nr:hypothetical protein [Protaetiibacter sp. WY-16]MDO7880817.1 hypothetical protein [Protaetiibacter sp. WY-16]